MPICLFGADASRFEYGYIAGFGSTNFADVCWTSKSGPHPFEQCKHHFRGPDGTLHEVNFKQSLSIILQNAALWGVLSVPTYFMFSSYTLATVSAKLPLEHVKSTQHGD